MIDLDRIGLTLIPGPLNPPAVEWSSLDLHGIEHYRPERVAEVLLSVPGAVLLSDGDGDWYRWSALWDLGGSTVGVGFSQFDIEPPAWGGSELTGMVDARALIDAWLHIRKALPAVWLHDGECTVYTPEAFAAKFA